MKVLKFALLVFIAGLHVSALHSQPDWRQKISPWVLQDASDGGSADFIVLLKEQADVREAAFLPLKKEKAQFVFQKLSETAARTQGRVLDVLLRFQAPHQSFWIINAVQAEGEAALLQTLAEMPEVEQILSNPHVKFQEPERVPNSEPRSVTWGIDYINADDVWALGYTGGGVVIGGQDTGYEWDHAALKPKYRGWDEVAGTADHNYNWHDAIHEIDPHNSGSNPCGLNALAPCDDHNHGTHTMGTMAGDDGGQNQIGVAPGAKWIGCRNMERGWGKFSTYMECFQWFLAPTDLNDANPQSYLAPHVINNSWSCPEEEGCDNTNFAVMEGVVNNLVSAGVVVVVSAGNSGSGCETILSPPAIYPGGFSVGATNVNGDIAGFSSRGPVTYDGNIYIKPDVSAPGVSVWSCIRNGSYGNLSGTSMAGPHVAGVVALVISANPDLAGQVTQIENILKMTATPKTTSQNCGTTPGSEIPNNTYGHGIINALDAVNLALAFLPLELTSFTGSFENEGVRLHWEVALPGTLNHFEVEHATEGSLLKWSRVGRLLFSPSTSSYAFFHAQPASGTNYYRLKMVELDGSVNYSRIVVLERGNSDELLIYPNPTANGVLNIAGFVSEEAFEIGIYDSFGRCVIKQKSEFVSPVFQMEIQDLPTGVYYVKVAPASGKRRPLQYRFIKQN